MFFPLFFDDGLLHFQVCPLSTTMLLFLGVDGKVLMVVILVLIPNNDEAVENTVWSAVPRFTTAMILMKQRKTNHKSPQRHLKWWP